MVGRTVEETLVRAVPRTCPTMNSRELQRCDVPYAKLVFEPPATAPVAEPIWSA